jgi:mannose-6-phosphate isomerase-like protein (cupin superfamily)
MTVPDARRAAGPEPEALRVTRDRGGPEGVDAEEFDWLAGPGWAALPVHRHDTEERYEILSGRVRVVVEGSGRTYRVGESVIVAAGQPHTLQPVDGHGVHVRVQRWPSRGTPT